MPYFLLALLFLHTRLKSAAICSGKKLIRIGGMFPVIQYAGYDENIVPAQQIAAFSIAIRQINNKRDGYADSLLPDHCIVFSIKSSSSKNEYLSAASDALDMSINAFNHNSVLACVGPANGISGTEGAAAVFSGSNIIHISSNANDVKFASKSIYPNLIRTSSSDNMQGLVLANIISNLFGHPRVSILYSTAFRSNILLDFITKANALDITISSSYDIDGLTEDWTEQINRLLLLSKETIPDIFVLFCTPNEAVTILQKGQILNIFDMNTQIFGASSLSYNVLMPLISELQLSPTILNGYISISPILNKTTPEAITFLTSLRQQNSTSTPIAGLGTPTCDDSVDDDTKTYLYRTPSTVLGSPASTCFAPNFSSLADDGSNLDDSAYLTYDSVYALAHAFHSVLYDEFDNPFFVPNGTLILQALKDAFINNVSFTGASGRVAFSKGYGAALMNYEEADRNAGLLYEVQLVDSILSSSAGPVIMGMWSSECGDASYGCFKRCGTVPGLSSAGCSAYVLRATYRASPWDGTTTTMTGMSIVARVAINMAVFVCLVVIGYYIWMVVLFRQVRILKASQPAMLLFVLAGGLTACARVTVATIDATPQTCTAGLWLAHLSFFLVFGSITLKTWRIGLLMNSGLRRTQFTKFDVYRVVLCACTMIVTYLVLLTVIGRPYVEYTSTRSGYNIEVFGLCQLKYPYLVTALYVVELVLLGTLAKACWRTKDIPDAVNESRYVALCKSHLTNAVVLVLKDFILLCFCVALYLLGLVTAITMPMVLLPSSLAPVERVVVMCVAFIVATIFIVLIIFLPKALLLFGGADLDENMGIVQSSRGGSFPYFSSHSRPSVSSHFGATSSQASLTALSKPKRASRVQPKNVVSVQEAQRIAAQLKAASAKNGVTLGEAEDYVTATSNHSLSVRKVTVIGSFNNTGPIKVFSNNIKQEAFYEKLDGQHSPPTKNVSKVNSESNLVEIYRQENVDSSDEDTKKE